MKDNFEKYVCKIGDKKDLLDRWEYLVDIHKGKDIWKKYRDNNIKNFDNGFIIPYYGVLEGKIICEITSYINIEAFKGDINNPKGLLDINMAYLAAFRTNKEYEGKGYFSKLYRFVEEDFKKRGYTKLSLGVSPEDVRNIEIYFHLGYKEYIKTVVEKENINNQTIEEYINFYKKNIL